MKRHHQCLCSPRRYLRLARRRCMGPRWAGMNEIERPELISISALDGAAAARAPEAIVTPKNTRDKKERRDSKFSTWKVKNNRSRHHTILEADQLNETISRHSHL